MVARNEQFHHDAKVTGYRLRVTGYGLRVTGDRGATSIQELGARS